MNTFHTCIPRTRNILKLTQKSLIINLGQYRTCTLSNPCPSSIARWTANIRVSVGIDRSCSFHGISSSGQSRALSLQPIQRGWLSYTPSEFYFLKQTTNRHEGRLARTCVAWSTRDCWVFGRVHNYDGIAGVHSKGIKVFPSLSEERVRSKILAIRPSHYCIKATYLVSTSLILIAHIRKLTFQIIIQLSFES